MQPEAVISHLGAWEETDKHLATPIYKGILDFSKSFLLEIFFKREEENVAELQRAKY